jgi:hypothetical protein
MTASIRFQAARRSKNTRSNAVDTTTLPHADRRLAPAPVLKMGVPMLDVMMVAIALGFFVVALGYVVACDRM